MPGASSTATQSDSDPGVALKGIVHGGQQPIVGAHVYLLAANTTGYGNASVSVLASASGTSQDSSGNYYVTSQAQGAFSITGEYTCPSSTSQVYLYATGGDPGLGEGTNSAIGLMAALGTCETLSSSTYVVINEVSTIATAYALAGFATDATHISSSSSTLATATDVPNAFATVANIYSLSTGFALATTPKGNGTVPQAEIDTLADILAACVNSSGPSSTPCSSLFANAEKGNSEPSETATAAINIAHNPGANAATLFGLLPSNLAFQPTMASAPSDFTISITYANGTANGGLDGTGFAPEGIAIDASGNVWVPNYASSTISELNSNGAPVTGSPFSGAGLDEPTSIAIDTYGNVWAANYLGNDVSEFNSSGEKISNPPGWIDGGLNEPYGITIDNVGHAWIADFGGNCLSEFSSSLSYGLAISGSSGYGSGTLVGPAGIAADTSGNVWTVNYTAATSSLAEAVPSSLAGVAPTLTLFTGGGLNAPYGVAIDSSGNVWITNRGGDGSISEFTSSGVPVSGSPFSGGGVSGPYGIAVDGAGNVWTANNGGNSNSISEFTSSGAAVSGSNGYVSNGLIEPYGIAIDGSGNVWVASDNTAGPLTEFVGAAVPVVTPISVGTEYKELGTRP
ncbi:MAG: NHL repeat-containing protein [Terracidiphilus sp.]